MADYHFQPDGQGGYYVTDVARIRAHRNAISAITTFVVVFSILAGLYKLYEIISPYDKIITDFIIPIVTFFGIVQYPIIRRIDRIRGYVERPRPVLRRINRVCLVLWIFPMLEMLYLVAFALAGYIDPHFYTQLMHAVS
jgi:hypothetical protein